MVDDLIQADAINDIVEAEQRQIENAIKAAILGNCDGVDVVRFLPAIQDVGDRITYPSSTIHEIRTWTYDDMPPEPKTFERVERYEWKWFDVDRLKKAVANDTVMELFDD